MAQQKNSEVLPEETQEMLTGIVDQIEDLVRLLVEGQSREVKDTIAFADIHKQLHVLKSAIEQFDVVSQNIVGSLKKEGLVPKIEELPQAQKKIIDRLEKLTTICEKEKSELYQSLQEHKHEVKEVLEKELDDNDTKTRKRKGRLKGTGAKRNWIPS